MDNGKVLNIRLYNLVIITLIFMIPIAVIFQGIIIYGKRVSQNKDKQYYNEMDYVVTNYKK